TMVPARLPRAISSPDDFQGAHSVLGSASHSGFGSEPAIVVGNSMGVSPGFLIGRTICHVPHVRYICSSVRHARPCAGHPRPSCLHAVKTWMAGTSPAMTTWRLQ